MLGKQHLVNCQKPSVKPKQVLSFGKFMKGISVPLHDLLSGFHLIIEALLVWR
jgi:predicted HicB family RNase H-like nuclease